LFVDCNFSYSADISRQSQYFTPHTTIEPGRIPVILQDDKWFNNLFIGKGIDNVPDAPGYKSDFNVFLEGAEKSSFGDKHSFTYPYITNFRKEDQELGVSIMFSVSNEIVGAKGQMTDGDLVGIFKTTSQTIEDRSGKPIEIDSDFNGRKFNPVKAGPLANLKKGINTITWSYKKTGE